MINSIDHIVLTTYRLDACIHFYTQVLQFSLQHFGQDRIAFKFGNQKINVHPINRTGAQGSIESIYLRDPDLNLIEIARYIENP